MLKPDTNSDSPSAKSKGARLVSARLLTNHIPKRGGKRKKYHKQTCTEERVVKLNLQPKSKRIIRSNPIVTS